MRNFGSSLFLLILLSASAAAGFFVNSRLHEKHKSRDSIELVQLGITLLVTFAAIVLGLLTTSVKSAFDAAYSRAARMRPNSPRSIVVCATMVRRPGKSGMSSAVMSRP